MPIEITPLDELQATILVENTAPMADRLRAVHGLSMLVRTRCEGHESNVLFDVGGDPDVLLNNMEALRVDPSIVDCVVLSHNHWDHARGLPRMLKAIGRPSIPVVVHPAAFRLNFYNRPRLRVTSAFRRDQEAIEEAGGVILPVSEPLEVCTGLFTSGHVERVTGEPTGVATKVLADDGTWGEDPVDDDQFLWASVKGQGVVILTGCSHSGIVNILRHTMKIASTDKISAVIGGFHLIRAPEERIARTIGEFRSAGVDLVSSGHCTGFDAAAAMRQAFGDKYRPMSVGERFVFPV